MAAATSQERLAFGFTVLRGYKVEAQVTSGIVYEGIFITANYDQNTTPDKHGIVLKYARVIRDPSVSADKDAPAEKPSKTKIILASDLVHLLAKDVRMSPEDLSGQHEDLETDAAISRGRGGTFGRELQPWMPEAGDTGPSLSLDDSTGGWDQFAVNKEKFGVTTTYNETLYTTVLNKENCAISEEAAQRIAKEIEAGAYATTGLAAYHMAEERGMDVDDGDMNEEDRYGAVVRELPLEPTTRRGSRGSGAGSGPHALPGPHAMNNNNNNSTGNNNAPPPPPPRAWGGLGAGVAVVAGARPGVGAPAGPLSGGANGDASHQGSGSAAAAAAPAPGGPQGGSWRSVAAPAANGEDSGRLPHGKGPRMPPSNSLPIRGGQKPNNLSDRHAGLDALSLAVPGPSSTPPELRANFGRWKAQQVEDKKNIERQNTLNELRGIAAAPNPAFTTRHNFHNTHGLATAQPLGINHQLVPPLAINHTPQPAAAPNHATPAAVTTQAAPAASVPAMPATTAAAPAAAPAATPAAAPPKKSALNPNAKEFTLNIGAKPFVPGGGAAPAPSAPPAAAAAPLAPVTSTVLGFGPKQPLQGGGFVHQGPYAMHSPMPHAMVHGDGHHGGHSAHVHHGVSNTMQQPSDIVQSLMHAQHAQQGMRMGGLQGGLPGAPGADHLGMSAGGGPHGMPVPMGGSGMGPAGLQGINPASGMPFVTLTPGATFGQMAQVGPNGQPMQLSPGAMMGPHGMMGGPQVMFTGPPQGAHVRPGGMPAGAPQPAVLMPVGMPAGGMQQHNGFNYMQGPQGYAMVPMPGNAPITSTMHPGMAAAMQMQGGPSMGQGQGHVGNQGADMHMRSQGQGLMKGMMGGGRGGGRGGRGMDGHGHMGMQHMGHMGGGHMMPHMVMQVTHDGPKPQQPPPPPPPHDAHHA